MKASKSVNPFVKGLVLLGLLLSMAASGMAQSQVTIPGTKVKYTVPTHWHFLKTDKVDKNTNVYLYYYSGKILVSQGDTALPFLRIRVRKNYSGDLVDYVYDRYVAEPYQPLKDYTHGLGLPKNGGLGYIPMSTTRKTISSAWFISKRRTPSSSSGWRPRVAPMPRWPRTSRRYWAVLHSKYDKL